MPDNPLRHYLLTAHEAELLACFRLLDESKQGAVASLIASLVADGRHPLAEPAKLSLVRKD